MHIADTMTLLYGCRPLGPGKVRVTLRLTTKQGHMPMGVFPSKNTKKVIDELKKHLPVMPAKNALETVLLNPNPVIHPIPSILSINAIEKNPEGVKSYADAMTPVATKCMDVLDEERATLCKALDFDFRSMDNLYYEALKVGPVYKPELSAVKENQSAIYHEEERFLTEDVPYGLVPWSSIGQMLDVPTPTIDATIQFASIIKETNYRETGQTLEDLGIAGLNIDELDEYLSEGAL